MLRMSLDFWEDFDVAGLHGRPPALCPPDPEDVERRRACGCRGVIRGGYAHRRYRSRACRRRAENARRKGRCA